MFNCRPSTAECEGNILYKNASGRKASLGLRIQLPDGTQANTAVTHGFVRLPGWSYQGRVSRATDLYQSINDTLSMGLPKLSRREHDGLLLASSDETPTLNTPSGMDVWSVTGGRENHIGTITHTFDHPSAWYSYPSGYTCDLSLLTAPSGQKLPQTGIPSNTPEIDGWGCVEDALEGQPLFVASVEDGHGKTTSAVAEGMQYLWDDRTVTQSASLLWRTVPSEESLKELSSGGVKAAPLQRKPGSLLCLGQPTDTTAKALVFLKL